MAANTVGVGSLCRESHTATRRKGMSGVVSDFSAMYAEKDDSHSLEERRKEEYATVVDSYYEIATSFFEYGWGKSFHFADRYRDESFEMSVARHEYSLAHALSLRPSMSVLDVGCGIGGPMRAIARFTGASITGVNLSRYQVERTRKLNAENDLSDLCSVVEGDFHSMDFEDNSFDAAYEIEATVHSPALERAYAEILRVLKPGGCFAGYEWCMTDRFDPEDSHHVDIRERIMHGDGLPTIATAAGVTEAFAKAGFEVEECEDRALRSEVPWYAPLESHYSSLSGFKSTRLGRSLTHWMLVALQCVGLMPGGSVRAHSELLIACDALVEGGRLGIFTPMMFFKARKPMRSQSVW